MARILIVDDDAIDREAARRALSGLEDVEFDEAVSGEEALERIAANAPDLVLTDLRMSGMTGLDLLRTLRDEHRSVPAILMTSQGSEKIAVEALRLGAMSYVPKRDVPKELADTVRRTLGLIEARHSRERLLRFLERQETHFELDNDPKVIGPLGAYVQESLERLGFGDDGMRTQVAVALVEAVSNAMIHGNLEVDSSLRDVSHEAYERKIAERRAEPAYAGRRIRCEARESANAIEYAIHDQGPGFDPSGLPDPRDPENLLKLSGRGILLIRTFMDEVEFLNAGATIVMRKRME
jgi:CheY-like chemotaxis protein